MTSQLLQHTSKFALMIGLLVPLTLAATAPIAVAQTSYSTSATQASFSEAQLDSLLAPIALYPDTVLSHVLIASTYPLEVVEADRWARNNSRLKGDDAVNAVDNKDWDPSVKALVAFPDILQRMSDDLDWTQQLGDAFLADEERVMDSIQTLRNRAYASGNLDNIEHVKVVREEKTIVIEPSVERVVYVPAYDTRVVYGNWWWADYPPVYWNYPSSYVFISGFYWGPRVYIGPRFYFSGCHWAQRRVVVVDRYHNHGHRFYNSRSVVRHNDAKHWHHNPVHRRGVAYYDNRTRDRFNSPRESYRDTHQYRANLRDNNGRPDQYAGNRLNNSRIMPNNARDQRQGRDDPALQRLERRQAGQITNNSANVSNDRAVQRPQPRADELRERMNSRYGRDQGNLQSRAQTNNPNRPNSDIRQTERSNRVERTETQRQQNPNRTETRSTETRSIERSNMPRTEQVQRVRPESNNYQSGSRIQQAQQQSRTERPTIQRLERQAPGARTQPMDRPQTMQRPQTTERYGRTDPGRQSDNRTEIRGGRER